MASNVGWRNFWWLNVAVNTFVFVAVLVGFPETKWHRPHANEIGANAPIRDFIGSEKQHIRHDSGSVAVPLGPSEVPRDAGSNNAVTDTYTGKGRPSNYQWRILQPASHPLQSLVAEFILPWRLIFYPIVLFASFVVSFSSTCYLMITFVQSEGLGGKPYHFNSQTVGFTNFASLVGAFLGLLTAGPASDIISAILTKRNKGIREPEMRLIAMVPYAVIMVLGNFIVGFGLQHSWDWKVSRAVLVTSVE